MASKQLLEENIARIGRLPTSGAKPADPKLEQEFVDRGEPRKTTEGSALRSAVGGRAVKLQLTPENLRALRMYAAKNERSMSDVANELIGQHLIG